MDRAPAIAICSSCCEVAPDTPTAPMHSSPTVRGNPPCTRVKPGIVSRPGRSRARSSSVFVGRRMMAADLAFATASSALCGNAPSSRSRARRCPPSSTTAMETLSPALSASARAAETIERALSLVSTGLLRIRRSIVAIPDYLIQLDRIGLVHPPVWRTAFSARHTRLTRPEDADRVSASCYCCCCCCCRASAHRQDG